MHEYSFIESILKNIKNKKNISKITLEVGELAGIEPKHLAEHLIEKTNWNVSVCKEKSYVNCVCGYKGGAKILQRFHDFVVFECPKCHKIPKILKGKDIKILKVVYK